MKHQTGGLGGQVVTYLTYILSCWTDGGLG